MDWSLIDGVAVAVLGVLFIMWADIIYGFSGTINFNSIALFLLLGGSFLTVGVGWLVMINGGSRNAVAGQTLEARGSGNSQTEGPGAVDVHSAVTVSGSVLPTSKTDVHPSNVNFTNTRTGERFSAAIVEGQYSAPLRNGESYWVTVSWADAVGSRTGAAQCGTLDLKAQTPTYPFHVKW